MRQYIAGAVEKRVQLPVPSKTPPRRKKTSKKHRKNINRPTDQKKCLTKRNRSINCANVPGNRKHQIKLLKLVTSEEISFFSRFLTWLIQINKSHGKAGKGQEEIRKVVRQTDRRRFRLNVQLFLWHHEECVPTKKNQGCWLHGPLTGQTVQWWIPESVHASESPGWIPRQREKSRNGPVIVKQPRFFLPSVKMQKTCMKKVYCFDQITGSEAP